MFFLKRYTIRTILKILYSNLWNNVTEYKTDILKNYDSWSFVVKTILMCSFEHFLKKTLLMVNNFFLYKQCLHKFYEVMPHIFRTKITIIITYTSELRWYHSTYNLHPKAKELNSHERLTRVSSLNESLRLIINRLVVKISRDFRLKNTFLCMNKYCWNIIRIKTPITIILGKIIKLLFILDKVYIVHLEII